MKKHLIIIFLIFTIAIALYANTLRNGFVYDDIEAIVNNALIKDFSNLSGLFKKDYLALSGETSYRPVVTFSYFIDYALYGMNPWGYHLTNIILHAVNGILLYVFLSFCLKQTETRDYFGQRPSGNRLIQNNAHIVISLLFVTHPVLTEAVNGISFREDLLAFFFYIATLILYATIRSDSAFASGSKVLTMYFLSCLCYLVALFSKEMALTLPIIVYCYEWLYKDNENLSQALFNFYNIGYVALTVLYIYFRFYFFANPAHEELPDWDFIVRLQLIPLLLLNYFKLILFPISLSTDYIIAPQDSIYPSLFIFSLIVVSIAFTMKKKKKEITFGIFFFIITLSPVYNIIRITNPFAERYLYLPAAGAIMASVLAGNTLFRSCIKSKSLSIVFLILTLFALIVIERNTIWKHGFALWSDTAKKMPGSSRAHYNLGYYNYELGRVSEAIEEYKIALKLKPDHQKAAMNLGLIYFNNGLYPEALTIYENILTKFPNDRFSIKMRAEVLKKLAR